jgi:hypothetical protein
MVSLVALAQMGYVPLVRRRSKEEYNDMAKTQHVSGAISEYQRLAPRIPPSFALEKP